MDGETLFEELRKMTLIGRERMKVYVIDETNNPDNPIRAITVEVDSDGDLIVRI